ncbi:hypothetical protein [Streptomyces sp. NPDC001401]|uniref:hypothetical protein n=1 Tax=Streptomyces sp. NPDC001401 TaxID=3364570 RepID=UPI0036C39C23
MAAGEIIAQFIGRELESLRQRRVGIEGRAVAVITTSGTLVTLQLAFVTAVAPRVAVKPTSIRTFLLISLSGFVAAAALGVIANMPNRGHEIEPASLLQMITWPYWDAEDALAKQEIAREQLNTWALVLRAVSRKGKLLLAAIAAELFGISSMSVAVFLIVIRT